MIAAVARMAEQAARSPVLRAGRPLVMPYMLHGAILRRLHATKASPSRLVKLRNRVILMTNFGTRMCSILFVAALGLSGCGSAEQAVEGGIGDEDDAAVRGETEYFVLLDEGNAINGRLNLLGPAINMPASGTASFDGIASMNWGPPVVDSGGTILLSRVTLNADFAANTIGGDFTGFERPSGAQIGGSLAVTNGRIAGTGVSFNLIGQLTGAVQGDIEASTENATFLGDGAQGIEGDLTGTFTGIGLEAAPLVDSFFVGARRP
jgi:hypothetical protein